MLTRERLWQRLSGASLWGLPWALASAAALPWVVPEAWDGQFPGWLLPTFFTLCLGSLPLLFRRRWSVVPLCLVLSLITLMGLRSLTRHERALPSGLQALEGTLSEPWTLRSEQRIGRIVLRAPAEFRGMELPISLPAEGVPAPEPGTPVRFRAELRAIEPAPAFLGERPLWRARDNGTPRRIRLRSADQMEVLGPPKPSLLLRLQVFAHRRFQELPLSEGPARDLWGALTLGYPPAQEDVFSAFAESGTIHTLVVSGLQVTLVMAFLEALWRRFLRRGSTLAAIIAGLLFSAVVGFSAPVWRGLLMGVVWALGRRSGWKAPPVLALHGALLLWLLTHPASGADPGFLLAWFALVGLIWCAEPLAGLLGPVSLRWALPASRFLAPWLTTLPLLALFHGGAPLWGVLANVLVLPLVAILTPLCLILTLLPLPSFALHIVPFLGGFLTWIGTSLVPFFARIQPLATGILWPWLLLCLGWIYLAQRHAGFRRTRALTLVLLVTSGFLLVFRGTGRGPTELSLEAADVGQGDALLLRVSGGDATLVDTGPSPWAARRIARVLSRRGVREPLHLVITHPHGDHVGGWTTLARLWPIESITLPDTARSKELWVSIAPPLHQAEARRVLRGDFWPRGSACFDVRWPPKPFELSDANMISQVLRVRWQDRELWLMGDVLAIQERDLLDLGDPGPATLHRLLKAGHHGSATTMDPAWVVALAPELVLFTVGRNNRFEFPSVPTLATLGSIPYVSTGPSRGVRIVAIPGGWRVESGTGEMRVVPLKQR
ncbi:MAG: ComEC/Rec2 family competence protein [Holophaga sp.]|nr:ComEC/Rec2 family competence protein [Holophaga sp.]